MAASDDTLRADARRNRRAVLDAAIALLAERPQATMQEVAAASGLGRTTVYRHFPRRQDLIDALFLEVLRAADAAVQDAVGTPGPALEVLHGLGPRLIAIGDRYRFLDAHPELRERALTVRAGGDGPLGAFLLAAQRRGELRDDLPVDWMLTALRGLAVVTMTEVSAGRLSVADAGQHLGSTLTAAFAPRRGK